MGEGGCILYCVNCDSIICEVSKFKVDKKGMVTVPGVVNTVKEEIEDKDFKKLVCSCGESVGEAVLKKNGWKYSLNFKKVIRSKIDNNVKREDGQSQVEPSSSGKQENNTKTGSGTSSCGFEKSAEFLEMKNRLQKLELQTNSMKMENMNKFKDMSRMLIMYKLEILRLQEIIWSLHPNFDINSAFILDNTDISVALNDYEKGNGFGDLTSEQ